MTALPDWTTKGALAALDDHEARRAERRSFMPLSLAAAALWLAERFAVDLEPLGTSERIELAAGELTIAYRTVEQALTIDASRTRVGEAPEGADRLPTVTLAALVTRAAARVTGCVPIASPRVSEDGTMEVRLGADPCREVMDLHVVPWPLIASLAVRAPVEIVDGSAPFPTVAMRAAPLIASGWVRKAFTTERPMTLYARELETALAHQFRRVFGVEMDVRIDKPVPTKRGEDPFTTMVFAHSDEIDIGGASFHLTGTGRELLGMLERMATAPADLANSEARRPWRDARLAELLAAGAAVSVGFN